MLYARHFFLMRWGTVQRKLLEFFLKFSDLLILSAVFAAKNFEADTLPISLDRFLHYSVIKKIWSPMWIYSIIFAGYGENKKLLCNCSY